MKLIRFGLREMLLSLPFVKRAQSSNWKKSCIKNGLAWEAYSYIHSSTRHMMRKPYFGSASRLTFSAISAEMFKFNFLWCGGARNAKFLKLKFFFFFKACRAPCDMFFS